MDDAGQRDGTRGGALSCSGFVDILNREQHATGLIIGRNDSCLLLVVIVDDWQS